MVTPLQVDGADLSHHNDKVDVVTAKRAGLKFLYHKVSEGDTFSDPDFQARREQARKARLPFGAYHFARPELGDAKEEARRFVRLSDPQPGDLIPALDLETTEGLTMGQLKTWTRNFSNEVFKLTSFLPVIYSPWNFGMKNVRWVPRYNNLNQPPTVPYDIWQFSNGRLGVPRSFPGLGNVDLNTFRPGVNLTDILIPRVPKPKPTPEIRRVDVAHISLQWGDPDKQQLADAKTIFSRNYHWLTGTEAGPGAGKFWEVLKEQAELQGYRFSMPNQRQDCWVAVKESMITDNWFENYEMTVPGSRHRENPVRRAGQKGLTWCEFDNEYLGHVSIGASHYLTGGHHPGTEEWEANQTTAKYIGEWARIKGLGKALVFYAGDQNMADHRNDTAQGDTFFGEPLTSLWDELDHYESTGFGTIDVIASYDEDARVVGKYCRALDDTKLKLYTDHYLVEGGFDIELLRRIK